MYFLLLKLHLLHTLQIIHDFHIYFIAIFIPSNHLQFHLHKKNSSEISIVISFCKFAIYIFVNLKTFYKVNIKRDLTVHSTFRFKCLVYSNLVLKSFKIWIQLPCYTLEHQKACVIFYSDFYIEKTMLGQ